MQRLNAAPCLLFALLAGVVPCHSEEPLMVEVVQTHTGVRLGASEPEISVNSDQAFTDCNEKSGIYSRGLGFYCRDAGFPVSQEPAESRRGYAFFFDVRVIMPDKAHLVFHCSTVVNRNCQGFPTYPEGASVVCSDFAHSGAAYKDCTASGPSAGSLGMYRAALHGDRMTIFGSHWRRSYLHHGTWQWPAVAALDPKPDPKPAAGPPTGPTASANDEPAQAANTVSDPCQDDAPAQSQETKPPAQEEKPSQPQETKQAPPPDTKPAPDPTPAQDSANTSPAVTAPLPAPGSDQAIDPQVIAQAKAGDPTAQYKLGYDYYLGRGVPMDYVQAAIWWKKAAEQGFPNAQNNLGVLYNIGKGVPQSYAEAYFWQNLAAARANVSLQAQFAKNRDDSAGRLWLFERLRVQKRAAKWAAEHPVAPRSHEPQPDEK